MPPVQRVRRSVSILLLLFLATGFGSQAFVAVAQGQRPSLDIQLPDYPVDEAACAAFLKGGHNSLSPNPFGIKGVSHQDVVVNGVVVVPRGSVGYAHIDKQVVSQVCHDLGPRNGIVRAHVYGPKENRVTQIVFHSEYVFSIASTQLQMDRTPDYIDEAHHNAEASQPPLPTLDYKPDSEFTVKLKHAVLNLPMDSAH